MNKIIYRVSKGDWSKSGWLFKQWSSNWLPIL
jgi:hypothetical protein